MTLQRWPGSVKGSIGPVAAKKAANWAEQAKTVFITFLPKPR